MPALIRRSALFLMCFSLSLPVMAAPAYVVDGDGDAVSDEIDDCPYTRPGTQVDASGCPLRRDDADVDGIADDEDACPYSAPGARVDAKGCALDSDFDGVPDGLDRCPRSGFALPVDARGCAAGEAAQVVVPSAPPVTKTTAAPAPAPAAPAPLPAPVPVVTPRPPVIARPAPAPVHAPAPAPAAAPAVAPASTPEPSIAAANAESPVLLLRFNVNSQRLGDGDMADIAGYARIFARRLAADPSARLRLNAYVDSRESDLPALAMGRMLLVRNALVAQGIPAALIRAENAVLQDGDAANNRRTEVRLGR